jgi:hypothetical protein
MPSRTVLVTNLRDGGNSLSSLISEEIRKFQIQIVSSEDDAEYPINRFEVWRDGKSCRSVAVMKDVNKWLFYERGEVESFEQPSFYSRKRKRGRLDRSILIYYMANLGWDIGRIEFWQSRGTSNLYSEVRKHHVLSS